MARDEPQINLRIPAELKERLEQASTQSKRSLTAEVVARLEESFASEGAGTARIDDRTLDMFADNVAGKVVKALDEREKRRSKR
ncbi:hypothetical protein C9I57_11340 [Trinickia symbiotica]|uniref:Arc-like DNA binding domain-containing protein n=1 Tax=Trinickia symbiotica TaxID=863227 RepID=A0A2T3XW36_9BURK|nr:Arc family DNA-binding protein [Trinickia symbiotica]PTB20736.1 hypothetical protein C9I57_11340 [Trinickia symbiotica]